MHAIPSQKTHVLVEDIINLTRTGKELLFVPLLDSMQVELFIKKIR